MVFSPRLLRFLHYRDRLLPSRNQDRIPDARVILLPLLVAAVRHLLPPQVPRQELVQGARVRSRASHDDVRVRPCARELFLTSRSRLQVGGKGVVRSALLGSDGHSSRGQRLDALRHGLQRVRLQVDGHAHDGIDRLVHGVDGSRPGRGRVPFHSVRTDHLDGRGRYARHARGHLQSAHLPKLVDQSGLVDDQSLEVLVLQSALLLLGHLLEPREDLVQAVQVQVVPQFLEARPDGVPSRVLPQHDARAALRVSSHESDGLGSHDLVRFLVLDHAVLMDAGLVLEGVHSHDGLVGLTLHARVLGHELGGRGDVHGVDRRPKLARPLTPPELRPSLQRQTHHHLLQARVARPLSDAVDGTFQLPRSVLGAGQRVGRGQSQVVLTVRGKHDVFRSGHVLPQPSDQLAELPRHVPTRRVGDVQGGGSRHDDFAQDAVQEFGIGPSGVLRTEFDVVASQALGVRDGLHGDLDHFIRGLVQLRLHVNRTGGYEGMYPRPNGSLDGVPRGLDVPFVRSTQSANDGHVPVVERFVPHHVGDLLDGVEVVGTRDGKAGLDDVDSELGEIPGDFQLFRRGEGGSRGLFAVAESRVEDADVVRVGDFAGDVVRTGFSDVQGGVLAAFLRPEGRGDAERADGGGGGRSSLEGRGGEGLRVGGT
mmetsp:Transcript_42823/g.79313  ORF Transcript_42823/g.79313 Transcript_42823/m.79313 type:complete len:652 (+) Transcript_42823:184-2139(+)